LSTRGQLYFFAVHWEESMTARSLRGWFNPESSLFPQFLFPGSP